MIKSLNTVYGKMPVLDRFFSRFTKSAVWKLAAAFIGVLCLSVTLPAAPSMPEYQVKALFLMNFLKYVDWPEEEWKETREQPITIGIVGDDPFKGDLESVVKEKVIDGRMIVVKHVIEPADAENCELLFFNKSEGKKWKPQIQAISNLPILTVGEGPSFLTNGGIISFILKNEKVRLHVNLEASESANLKISSRLLKVADVVKK